MRQGENSSQLKPLYPNWMRSHYLKPREVIQEIYGWFLGHYAIRSLMFQASQQAEISPFGIPPIARQDISTLDDCYFAW